MKSDVACSVCTLQCGVWLNVFLGDAESDSAYLMIMCNVQYMTVELDSAYYTALWSWTQTPHILQYKTKKNISIFEIEYLTRSRRNAA